MKNLITEKDELKVMRLGKNENSTLKLPDDKSGRAINEVG